MKFVILAGGKGSRMQAEGASWSKPMTPLKGRPMIGRLIDQMLDCGASAVHIAANPAMDDMMEYLTARASADNRIVVRPIVTDNSYESLREATRGIEGKFIASTVDAIVDTNELRDMANRLSGIPDNHGIMGLMRNIHDETPLWACVQPSGEITDYSWGKEPFKCGEIASAGVYGLSGEAMKRLAASDIYPTSLSHSQQLLARDPLYSLYSFYFSEAYDVDNMTDRAMAEDFLNRR
ncbi:MAG: NTP transferase domain-containing protein [Muribaculaceae bacterium]|nr:NTP transferase domain-containing protein [Muribaculaceae bacterium]